MKMVVGGQVVALTTGTNLEAMKESLFSSYFHLPLARPAKKKPRK